MIKLSANKAAKEAGVAKKTLLEALTSGRMSAGKNEKGHWEIDPSELFRVFPKTSENSGVAPVPTHQQKPDFPAENSALAVEVKMLREQMAQIGEFHERERRELLAQIEDIRGRLDHEQEQTRRLTSLLPMQAPVSESVQKGGRSTWWPWNRKAGAA